MQLIDVGKTGAESQVQEFEKYTSLMNDTDNEKIRGLLDGDTIQDFQRFRDPIVHYDHLSRHIPVEFNRTGFSKYFVVHRGQLIDHIASVARRYKEELITKMTADYQQRSRA